ncbi:MAG: hypothetical protein ACUVRK_12770 [Spirochaetota bacterium]
MSGGNAIWGEGTFLCIKKLYEEGVNNFVSGVALLAIKAVIDAEIESKCDRPYEHSSGHSCYRHGKQKTGYVIIIIDHAPVFSKEEVEKRINDAYAEMDYDKARAMMISLASWGDKINCEPAN